MTSNDAVLNGKTARSLPSKPEMERSALLSDCGLYRYLLTREFPTNANRRTAVFIMLNPSTADAEKEDATLWRCIRYARDEWGCGALLVVNLYAYRATDPRELRKAADPIGPDNNEHLVTAAGRARDTGGPLVAAWGANARPDRINEVLNLPGMHGLSALALTKAGQPRHPLYLPPGLTPTAWNPPS